MLSREIIEEIRARTSLAEVVGRTVALTRSGTALKGLCPFHGEKTPSFNVNEARGIWHCFGCGEGGDVFGFVMKQENRAFMEVVEELAKACGVDLPKTPLTPEQAAARTENDRMLEANEQARTFFQGTLAAAAGRAARDYLRERGIGREIEEAFGLGYCGPGWDALAIWWRANRHDPNVGERAGLFSRRRSGPGLYDRFHERLVFPVTNGRGRVIGFGGRKMDGPTTAGDSSPKYLNSSESPVYKKSDALYGLDHARAPIGKTERVIVVEGYFDLLGLAQAGIGEVVATCGTALTPGHLAVLRRFAPKTAILLYDGDDAGRRAAIRALPIFFEAGIAARYAGLPQGHDPDTYVREIGPEAFATFLEGAVPLAEYFIGDLGQKAKGRSAAERAAILERVAPVFAKVPNPVERTGYANELAGKLGLSPEAVAQALARGASRAAARGGDAPSPAGGAAASPPMVAGTRVVDHQKRFGSSGFTKYRRDRFGTSAKGFRGRFEPEPPPGADLTVAQKLRTATAKERNFEEMLLRLMLGSRRIAGIVRAEQTLLQFRDSGLRSLGERIAEAVVRGSSGGDGDDSRDEPNVAAVLSDIADLTEAERRVITALVADEPGGRDPGADDLTFGRCRQVFRRRALEDREKELRLDYAAADRLHDSDRMNRILVELRETHAALAKVK